MQTLMIFWSSWRLEIVVSERQQSPTAGRHWITDFDGKKPNLTKNSKSDLEHLLGAQPSSRVGSAATPFPLLAFLGAIRKSTMRFTRIHWLNPKAELGSEKEQEILDLGAWGQEQN